MAQTFRLPRLLLSHYDILTGNSGLPFSKVLNCWTVSDSCHQTALGKTSAAARPPPGRHGGLLVLLPVPRYYH